MSDIDNEKSKLRYKQEMINRHWYDLILAHQGRKIEEGRLVERYWANDTTSDEKTSDSMVEKIGD